MYRIIDDRATGKTSRLMLLAKETGAVFVCRNPIAMREKAYRYGITGIEFISYTEFINRKPFDDKYLIDELEEFIRQEYNNSIIGYSISKE